MTPSEGSARTWDLSAIQPEVVRVRRAGGYGCRCELTEEGEGVVVELEEEDDEERSFVAGQGPGGTSEARDRARVPCREWRARTMGHE